jgi:hypothetical protein
MNDMLNTIEQTFDVTWDYIKTKNSHAFSKKLSVSKLVSRIYPFDEKSKEVWYNSLGYKWTAKKVASWNIIDGIQKSQGYATPELLNRLLLFIWSFTHLAFKSKWKMTLPKVGILRSYVESVYKCISDLKPEFIYSEKFLDWDEYCGTFDALWRVNGKRVLIDFKTWGAYKYAYWHDIRMYKKGLPQVTKDDLAKVQLQLSLYADILWEPIDELWAIWITPEWYHLFSLPRIYNAYENVIKVQDV